ncbi:hypothetical protein F5Y10DRAFT_234180, partial [Nemania abortiva]
MSGLEVAGVVLGVIPLVISALEHYKASKGVLAAFFKYKGRLDTLIFKLKMQRCFLHLHLIDLLKGAGVDSAVKGDLTEEECIRVLRNSENEQVVREYLGVVYNIFLEILRRYEACLTVLTEKLARIYRPTDAQVTVLADLLVANSAGSLTFGKRVRFTIEEKIISDLAEELKEDRLSLKDIVQAMHTRTERNPRRLSYKASLLGEKLEKVRENVMPLFNAICRGCTCKCPKHRIRMRLDSRSRPEPELQKALKKEKAEAEVIFDLMFDQGVHFYRTIVRARQKTSATSSPLARQGNGKVQFAPSITITGDANEVYHDSIQEKAVTDLCDASCRARMSSYILQLELINHNLLYDNIKPILPGTHKEYPDSELLDLFLRKGHQNYDLRMSPKQQTLLALDIASSVLQLRQTCWLDLDFRSTSMHLLLHENGSEEMLGPALFIERIVHTSKILNNTTMTQAPEPKTTLLELAIVLLEIWHHQPLDTCFGKLGIDVADTFETRRIAAIRWLEKTSSRLPLQHLAAVEQCLAVCSGRLRSPIKILSENTAKILLCHFKRAAKRGKFMLTLSSYHHSAFGKNKESSSSVMYISSVQVA